MQHSKKNELKPHLSKYWKIPPDQNAAFVAAMEDVLDIYARPYNPKFPVVCMDESSMQLIGEVHDPIPAAPGHPVLMDDEYIRNGVANIFIEVNPLAGHRQVKITNTRTRIDWVSWSSECLHRCLHRTAASNRRQSVIRPPFLRRESCISGPFSDIWAQRTNQRAIGTSRPRQRRDTPKCFGYAAIFKLTIGRCFRPP